MAISLPSRRGGQTKREMVVRQLAILFLGRTAVSGACEATVCHRNENSHYRHPEVRGEEANAERVGPVNEQRLSRTKAIVATCGEARAANSRRRLMLAVL